MITIPCSLYHLWKPHSWEASCISSMWNYSREHRANFAVVTLIVQQYKFIRTASKRSVSLLQEWNCPNAWGLKLCSVLAHASSWSVCYSIYNSCLIDAASDIVTTKAQLQHGCNMGETSNGSWSFSILCFAGYLLSFKGLKRSIKNKVSIGRLVNKSLWLWLLSLHLTMLM